MIDFQSASFAQADSLFLVSTEREPERDRLVVGDRPPLDEFDFFRTRDHT
jgi:hypothetical protein